MTEQTSFARGLAAAGLSQRALLRVIEQYGNGRPVPNVSTVWRWCANEDAAPAYAFALVALYARAEHAKPDTGQTANGPARGAGAQAGGAADGRR